MKRCTKCGEEKPRTDYCASKQHRDGLYPWCSVCRSSYRKTPVRAQADRERSRRRRNANPEAARERVREWMARNVERRRSYRAANAARWHANNQRWRTAHSAAVRASCALRRARRLSALPAWQCPQALTDFEETRWMAEGFLGGPVHLAHLVPLKGYREIDGKRTHAVTGLHVLENLEWMLATSNLSQGSKIDEALLDPRPTFEQVTWRTFHVPKRLAHS